MPSRVKLDQFKGTGKSVMVLPTGENLPPKDGRWISAILKQNLEMVVPIQCDKGRWFDDKNQAVNPTSIVRWFCDDPDFVAAKPTPPDYRGGDYDYGEYQAMLKHLGASHPS